MARRVRRPVVMVAGLHSWEKMGVLLFFLLSSPLHSGRARSLEGTEGMESPPMPSYHPTVGHRAVVPATVDSVHASPGSGSLLH